MCPTLPRATSTIAGAVARQRGAGATDRTAGSASLHGQPDRRRDRKVIRRIPIVPARANDLSADHLRVVIRIYSPRIVQPATRRALAGPPPDARMKYQHRVLGMLSLLAVITYLDRVCIAVAGPRMQDALQISPEAWGWVTSVFFLSYGIFEIPTGALGDRIGPRRVLTRIVAWWSAFTALTGVVSNYYVLVAVRFCFGAGEAGAYPNVSVVIGRWIPAGQAHTRLGSRVDDQPGRRGFVASARRADPDALWVAGVLLRVRFPGRGVEPGLVRVVPGFATRETRCQRSGAPRNRLPSQPAHHVMPWATALRIPALWRIAAIGACYVYRWDSSRAGCKRIW